MSVIDIDPVAARALTDRWYYIEDQDMYLLNMKAKRVDDYIIDLDCIVAPSKETGEWYWHTRTIFCDFEGYEVEYKEAMTKSMDVAFEIFNRHNAERIVND